MNQTMREAGRQVITAGYDQTRILDATRQAQTLSETLECIDQLQAQLAGLKLHIISEAFACGATTVIDWDSPQTVVSFAQAGLPMSDPDYFAAFVLDHILGGGGFSSRLMDEIREKRGLTYGVGTGLANKVLGETWQGGMATANDKTAEAVALVREVVGKIREGVTDKELADAKTYLTGEYPLRFDGNGKIAGILTGMQLMGMPQDYVNTRNARITAVTLDDVKRVAERLLDSKKLEFVLVGRPVGL